MYNCLDYNCEDSLGEHTLSTCSEELLGGVPSALLLSCDSQLTDASDASQINVEIAAGRAILVRNVKIALPEPSPITVDSNVACGTPVLVNYDRSMTIIDGNVNPANVTFYNTLFAGKKLGGAVLFLCGTTDSVDGEKVLWISSELKATGGLVIPDNNNAFMSFSGTFAWRKKTIGSLVDAPAGIFN